MKALKPLFSKKIQVVDAKAEAKPVKPDVFHRLSKEVEEEILSYIPVRPDEFDADGKVLANAEANGKQINSVNKRWNALFKPNLLCDRVVCHDTKMVESILKSAALQDANRQKAMDAKEGKERHVLRDLLLKKRKVVNYSGQPIIGTPLQLAWGAEDPEMINMIQQALLTLPDGKEIIKAQYAKQFPEGWQEKEEKEWAPILKAMGDAFVAIENGQDNDVTYENKKITIKNEAIKTAVNHFRTLLAEQMKKPVTMGRHFNSALWLVAAEICDNEERWSIRGGWSDRNRLANCQLYGFIQRYLPSRSMKATAQGMYYVVGGKKGTEFKPEPIQDSFKFRYEPSVAAYPLNSDSVWVLGENYYGAWNGFGEGAGGPCVDLGNFCRSTAADLQILRDLGQLSPKTLNRYALL